MEGHRKVWAGAAALLASGALLATAATAHAQRPASLGDGTPWGQTGFQLYDFNSYLSSANGQTGTGEIVCPPPTPDWPGGSADDCIGPPAPTTQAARLERVLKWASTKGVRNIELYGYPGNPFPGTNPATPVNIAGLEALRDLGLKYGIHFPGRHGNLTEANWDNQIIASKIIGQNHIGEAGFPAPGFGNLQSALGTAALLNRLGKRSVEAGLGPAYFHNHQQEFNTRFIENGVLRTAWEVIMDRTDPRWVSAQLDIGWAVCGLAHTTAPTRTPDEAMAEVTRLINKFTNRIVSYHVKDMVGTNIQPNCGNNDQREIGAGAVNFAPMFAAAKNRSKYYFMERDPVGIGGATNFNPFTNADNSLKAMRAAPQGTLYAVPPTFTSVAAGTPAAANQVPVTVTNDGDAPLTITAVAVQADALDGGNATAADFSIVSQNCSGTGSTPLAPRTEAVPDDPTTPADEFVGPKPGGTCTVNVGFKPTRTDYTSVARLQFTSTGDDAMDRVLLAAKSTRSALATVGGDVPSMLGLTIPTTSASFGTFVPAVTRTYDTALASTVTTTTGDAALSVVDQDTVNPGKLTNTVGTTTFALPNAVQVRAANAAQPNPAYAAVSGTPLTLVSWATPINQEPVTLGLRQVINSTDVLRSGAYAKVLTFTLSTTAP